MSEKRIKITTVDLERINEWLKENPNVMCFDIIVSGDESGIGSNVEVEYSHIHQNRPTITRVEISGVENW